MDCPPARQPGCGGTGCGSARTCPSSLKENRPDPASPLRSRRGLRRSRGSRMTSTARSQSAAPNGCPFDGRLPVAAARLYGAHGVGVEIQTVDSVVAALSSSDGGEPGIPGTAPIRGRTPDGRSWSARRVERSDSSILDWEGWGGARVPVLRWARTPGAGRTGRGKPAPPRKVATPR